MKEEKELVNLSRLYSQNIVGHRADFAKFLGYAEKNAEFRNWLDKLIGLGILEVKGLGNRNNIILYKVNRKIILKYVGAQFPGVKKLFYDHYEGIFRH